MSAAAPPSLTVRVLLFASYAERFGFEVQTLTLPVPATVGDVVTHLRAMPGSGCHPNLSAHVTWRTPRGQTRCTRATRWPACPAAIGGRVTMRFVTSEPIEPATLTVAMAAPDRGGVVSFLGLVRNHHGGHGVLRLEYSAYEPMAEAECGRIVAEAHSRWRVAIALQHRIGALAIGDVAVAIAVAAQHRDEAFAACRYVIEEVKRRVPIWKREYYADGTEAWVDPTAAPQPV